MKLKLTIADENESNAPYLVQAVYGSPLLHDSVKTKQLGKVSGDDEYEFELTTEFDKTFV